MCVCERLLAEDAIALLPGDRVQVQTPCGVFDGEEGPEDKDVTVVSIMRSGKEWEITHTVVFVY